MMFKVDQLPTANEICPFEPICTSSNTYDCPKYQDKLLSMPEDVDSEYLESVKERSELKYCNFLMEE